jgi:haloalkane dehalogenase
MVERLAAPQMPSWLESMVPFLRYRVAVEDDLAMHVMETGAGLPVLMIHGNPSWGFLYRKVVTALAGEPLRLIMPDLVGLGFSDKPRDAAVHSLDHHQRWMRTLIEKLELERFVLVVQDWGGGIGVGALDGLDVDVGLVVLNTVLTPPKKGYRPTAFHRFSHMPLLSDVAFRAFDFPVELMALAQGDKLSLWGAPMKAYRYPMKKLANRVAPLALARMAPNSQEHPSIAGLQVCARWIERFGGPTAIVWGDRDPILGRVRGWMEKLFPDAPLTRTQAGHFLQEEVPREIADAILDVAARLER